MKTHNHCCLCSQISGDAQNDLLHKLLGDGGDYVRRVPVENDHFAVIPSIGALVDGHVLLCSKSHVKSFACLDDSFQPDYTALKVSLFETLRHRFGHPVHCFEHGSSPLSSRITCTVDHAHLHLVPADVEVWSKLSDRLSWQSVQPTIEALRSAVGAREYLYYETPEGEAFFAVPPSGEFPSQFLRQVFAEALGRPETWNWRDHPSKEMVKRSLEVLTTA